MTVVPLSDVGLMGAADAAARRGVALRTVQKWIADGSIPVVVAGAGMRTVHLLRAADVDAFTAPKRGRPAKAQPPPKPKRKPRGAGPAG